MTEKQAPREVRRRTKKFLPWPRAWSLRTVTPQGLWPRSVLIVLIPVLLIQTILGFIFLQNHWLSFTERLTQELVSEIVFLIDLYEESPSPATQEFLAEVALESLDLNVSFLEGHQLSVVMDPPFFDLLDRTLSEQLSARMDKAFRIDTLGRSDFMEIRIALDTVTLRIVAERSRAFGGDSIFFMGSMVGLTLLVVTIMVLILRNQVKPIVRLSQAMEHFGNTGRPVSFVPRGAEEVRKAGRNFLRMQRRLERFFDQRRNLLSGISHDVRTVLTRLRLDLELLPKEERTTQMIADVETMTRTLNTYLSFARETASEEHTEDSLSLLLARVTDPRLYEGLVITLDKGAESLDEVIVETRLERVLGNILSNASRFASRALMTIRWDDERNRLYLTLDDNGPGIARDKRVRVFEPFFQLPSSEDSLPPFRDTFGLGLAIARDIMIELGGQITLDDSPLGGLRIVMTLPLQKI